jgi:hypothetical protein
MKNLFCLPFLCLFFYFTISSFDVQAQYYEAISDTSVRKGSSLGTYITTPMTFLMGASPYEGRFGLIYRRETGKGRNWRIQAIADVSDMGDNDSFLTEIKELTDSTIRYDYRKDSDVLLTARVGYEWSNPRKAIAPFYCVDAIAGVRLEDVQLGDAVYFKDTTQTSVYPDFSRSASLDLREDFLKWSIYAGASFTAGARVQASERVMLTAGLTVEAIASMYQDFRYRSSFVTDIPVSSVQLDFRQRLEFGFFYCF